MFSGTRNTDLINTLLNRRYLMIAKKYIFDKYGIFPDDYYAVHQGDDVWISNKRRHFAALLFYTLNEMGLIFNPIKQMFGHHRGEFLRIYYFNGVATGYSVRCIVNYLLRPLQSIPDVFLEGWIQTLTSGFATMARRGITLPILNVLYDTDVFYYTLVKAHIRDERPVSIPYHVLINDTLCGGLGCPRPGEYAISRQALPPLPPINMKSVPNDHKLATNMSDDWLSYISTRLPDISRQITADSLRAVMIQNNYADVLHGVGYGPDFKRYKNDWSAWIKSNIDVRYISQRSYTVGCGVEILNWTHITNLTQISDFVLNSQVHFTVFPHIKMQICSILDNPKSLNVELNSGVAAVCRRLACRSLFKDISTTSRSLKLSKVEALFWILTNQLRPINMDTRGYITLGKLIASNRIDLLEYITSDSYCGLTVLTYFMHPGQILAACAAAKEVIVTMLLTPELNYPHSQICHEVLMQSIKTSIDMLKNWETCDAYLPKILY